VENHIYGSAATTIGTPRFFNGDSGSAARFFYCAKSSQEDRNEGCEDLPFRVSDETHKRPRTELDDPRRAGVTPRRNNHPTIKPVDLMRYLVRLITPPGGIVLDPFCGSGSTGKGAMLEGLRFIGVELSAEYCELAQRRIEAVTKQGLLFA
jgi:site-specific DNA-methyltransferase (adenine-specific)